jgi:hypothetical protein
MNNRDLHQQSLNALLYHTAQTRPIPSTDLVISTLQAVLAAPEPEPMLYRLYDNRTGASIIHVKLPKDIDPAWEVIPLYPRDGI